MCVKIASTSASMFIDLTIARYCKMKTATRHTLTIRNPPRRSILFKSWALWFPTNNNGFTDI